MRFLKHGNILIILINLILILLTIECSLNTSFLTNNPNRTPVAIVSQYSFTCYPGVPVVIDASKTFDSDKQILTYKWSVLSAPSNAPFTISGDTTNTLTFQTNYYPAGSAAYSAPNPSYFGTYIIKLVTTDTYGATDTKSVTINVQNLAPTAAVTSSGGHPSPGTAITLYGGGSNDPDPDKRNNLSYSWSVIGSPLSTQWSWNSGPYGTTGFIPSPVTTSSVNFTPGTVGYNNGEGVYTLKLTVTDEYGLTSTSSSFIVETLGNTAPHAAATVGETNYGSSTTWYTNFDTTSAPATITGTFIGGNGPTFSFDGTPSNLTGATRNFEQDTLTYQWVIRGFTNSIALKINNVIKEYTSGTVLTTNPQLAFQTIDSNDFVPAEATSFIMDLTVSDGVKSTTLSQNFYIDANNAPGNTAPTAAVTVSSTNYGQATVTQFTNCTTDITATNPVKAAFESSVGPQITLDGTPSNSLANNVEQDTLSYQWVISGFTGKKTLTIGGVTQDYYSGDILSYSPSFTFQPTVFSQYDSTPATDIDFIITLTVSDGTLNGTRIINFDID